MSKGPQFDLSGRVALVTGASTGLGARFAALLAASGAKVVLTARRTAELERICGEIVAAGGVAITAPLDVVDERATIAAYDAAEAAFGTVDTIIANAGMNADGLATDLPADAFDRVMQVNLRGVFLTAREGARRLIAAGSKDNGRGRIVIVGSITAFEAAPGLAAYSASKAGVLQLGKVMAREWVRQGVNVNVLCPGYVRTELTGAWFDTEAGRRQIEQFHRKRLMDQSDLDAALMFLASDASRGVTGASLTVDDGQSL